MTKLSEALGMGEVRSKLPPKYEPRVNIRVFDDRTRQTFEFFVTVATTGETPGAFDKAASMLRGIFERVGHLPAPTPESSPAGP